MEIYINEAGMWFLVFLIAVPVVLVGLFVKKSVRLYKSEKEKEM